MGNGSGSKVTLLDQSLNNRRRGPQKASSDANSHAAFNTVIKAVFYLTGIDENREISSNAGIPR